MRALHFDCFSGISGDMTLAALIEPGTSDQIDLTDNIVEKPTGSLSLGAGPFLVYGV